MQKTIGTKKVLIMDSPFATPLKLPCGTQLPNPLFSNTAESQNTASGDSALYSNTGSDNTAIVPNALFTNTRVNKDTAIGRLADVTGTDLKNAIAIREQLRANQPPDSEFLKFSAGPLCTYNRTHAGNSFPS